MSTTSPPNSQPSAIKLHGKAKPTFFLSSKSLLLLAAIIASFSVWYFGFHLAAQKPLVLSGLIQAKEVKNASRFGGRVLKILVAEGDTVKAGQPLIQFDDIELKSRIADARAAATEAKARRSILLGGADRGDLKQAAAKVDQANQQYRLTSQGASVEQLAQAKSALASAKIKREAAESAFKNADRMLDEGIISQQKHQEIQTTLEASNSQYSAAEANLKAIQRGAKPEEIRIAQSQVAAAKAQYQQLAQGAKRQDLEIANASVEQAESNFAGLEAQLSEVTLKAPISGVVSTVSVSQGELVQGGRPVITILNPDQLWTDVYVPESQLGLVKPGQFVTVYPTAIKHVWFDGKVSSISLKSEFVPGGESTGTGSSEESVFKVKVSMSGKQQAHCKSQSDCDKNAPQLRSGMNVQVNF